MVQRMTRAGRDALQAEIEHLETVERMKMAEQIKTAREFGDLKENAEYHAAKDASGHLETRILKLKDQLASAVVIEVEGGDKAGFGSTVEVEDEAGKKSTFTMVAQHETAPVRGQDLDRLADRQGARGQERRRRRDCQHAKRRPHAQGPVGLVI